MKNKGSQEKSLGQNINYYFYWAKRSIFCPIHCYCLFWCCVLRLRKQNCAGVTKRIALIVVNVIFILSGGIFSIIYGMQQIWGIMAVTMSIFLFSVAAFCCYFTLGSYQMYLFINVCAWAVSLTVGHYTIPTGMGILNNSSMYAFIIVPGLPLVFGGCSCQRFFWCIVYFIVFLVAFGMDMIFNTEPPNLSPDDRRMEAFSRYFLVILGQCLIGISAFAFIYSNERMVRRIEKVTASIITLDLYSKPTRKLMKISEFRSNKLIRNVQRVIEIMREYLKYLPEHLRAEYQQKLVAEQTSSEEPGDESSALLTEDDVSCDTDTLTGSDVSYNEDYKKPSYKKSKSNVVSTISKMKKNNSFTNTDTDTLTCEMSDDEHSSNASKPSSHASSNSSGKGRRARNMLKNAVLKKRIGQKTNQAERGRFGFNLRKRNGILLLATNREYHKIARASRFTKRKKKRKRKGDYIENQMGLEESVNSFITIVQTCVSRNSGSVLRMLSDSLLCSFNVPLRCINPEEKAVKAAVEIMKRCEKIHNVGIVILCSEELYFGNIGSEQTKRFDAISSEIPCMYHLELFARKYNAKIMIDDIVREQGKLKYTHDCRELDIFRFPITSYGSKLRLLSRVEGPKRRTKSAFETSGGLKGNDEWMYLIADELDATDTPGALLSLSWKFVMDGDMDKAREVYDKLSFQMKDKAKWKDILEFLKNRIDFQKISPNGYVQVLSAK